MACIGTFQNPHHHHPIIDAILPLEQFIHKTLHLIEANIGQKSQIPRIDTQYRLVIIVASSYERKECPISPQRDQKIAFFAHLIKFNTL
ncbi:MAG: hypothetical protein KU28_07435 [Sulfurovum sp. PC08-66]|nr:MAG: hypothetical protein KU28_07435 [Sulfurovum sp. PC08-66]